MDLDAEGIKDPLSFVFNYFLRLSLYVRTATTVQTIVQRVVIILSKSILSPPFDGLILSCMGSYINMQSAQKYEPKFVYFCMYPFTTGHVILEGERQVVFLGISDARKRANDKYLKEKVDELKVRVPKGEKDEIKAHAAKMGESLNGFILRAICETMERDINKTEKR